MNSAIEIHDSTIGEIVQQGEVVVIRFTPAYIHRTEGKPGWDAGTGWVQNIELRIAKGIVDCGFDSIPQQLDDGLFRIGDTVHKNLIPLPIETEQSVRLECVTMIGEDVIISGYGAMTTAISEARFVEAFPGSK